MSEQLEIVVDRYDLDKEAYLKMKKDLHEDEETWQLIRALKDNGFRVMYPITGCGSFTFCRESILVEGPPRDMDLAHRIIKNSVLPYRFHTSYSVVEIGE